MDDLLDLRRDILDAIELLEHAARRAGEISGESGGRAPTDVTIDEACPACNGTGRALGYDFQSGPTRIVECPACGGEGTYTSRLVDPGEPAVEGWAAMATLSGELDALARKAAEAFTEEIRLACEAEAAEQDRLADMADGRSE